MQQSHTAYSPAIKMRPGMPASRSPAGSLMAAVAGLHCEFFPVHGLFENQHHGYLAEFDHDDGMHMQQEHIQIDLAFYAAQQFLASQQDGILCIPTHVHLLQSRSYRHELNQLIISHPGLYQRLTLLLQYDDASHARQIHPLCQNLSIAGIALAIDIQQGQLIDMEPNKSGLLSPCVLIHYSDTMMLNHTGAHNRLSDTIRSCRKAGWPILVDYRLDGETPTSTRSIA